MFHRFHSVRSAASPEGAEFSRQAWGVYRFRSGAQGAHLGKEKMAVFMDCALPTLPPTFSRTSM